MSSEGPDDLLRLARDFMESRILLSGAELNLFTILRDTPVSAGDLAAVIDADVRALKILLNALSAMGLLVKQGETYQTEAQAASFLSDDTPGSILPLILHSAHLWKRWSGLTDIVRHSAGAGSAGGSSKAPEELRSFIGAMNVIAQRTAPRIVEAVGPGLSKRLLDVGGASGTYTIAFLRAAPEMKATLFDRPAVVEMARERLAESGLLSRVDLVAGDFYKDEFPPGHDLAFVSAIIHQNSPEQNIDLFKKTFRALVKGGRIVIRDHVMDTDRIHPRDGAIFAVNMLVGTAGGGTYTFDEIAMWLGKAGFTDVRFLRKGEHMDALVEARA
ncbi:MAG: methyltransferase [Syntrophales bacterium]